MKKLVEGFHLGCRRRRPLRAGEVVAAARPLPPPERPSLRVTVPGTMAFPPLPT